MTPLEIAKEIVKDEEQMGGNRWWKTALAQEVIRLTELLLADETLLSEQSEALQEAEKCIQLCLSDKDMSMELTPPLQDALEGWLSKYGEKK